MVGKPALLKLLLLVFTLNATAGYAACCGEAPADNTQASLPCHETPDNSSMELEKCCAACFISLQSSLTWPAADSPDAINTREHTVVLATSADPPFRPPANRLS